MYLEDKQKFVEPLKAAGAKPFSLESLIAWLEKQNPDETYLFLLAHRCIWGIYTKACGGEVVFGPHRYVIGGTEVECGSLGDHWRMKIACPTPHTFGAALERARSYQASEGRGSYHV